MSTTKRQNEILDILHENGFMTVERLSELTFTSPSSIRRDLTKLQNLSLIRRKHGGAEALTELNDAIPFNSRMAKNVSEKRRIAKIASSLLKDGQSVMLDGSTTAGFLIPYIAKHKDMIVFTNNMLTAISSVNYGIKTYCIGGFSVNQSVVLSGDAAYRAVENIYPDILFFSSKCLDKDGGIYDPIPEENYIRELMLKNAKYRVFLCDSEKFGSRSLYKLTDLDSIDACVFDKQYDEIKTKCKIPSTLYYLIYRCFLCICYIYYFI